MVIDFTLIAYLKSGNERQRHAYAALQALGIFENLKAYAPLLAGTIPIGIDLPESDLDIICQCSDHAAFSSQVEQLYSDRAGFTIYTNDTAVCSTVANFRIEGFEIEVFAQNVPSREQYAFRHMLIEHALLQAKGPEFKEQIVQLKRAGLKTEPAFAKALGLEGDPYQALLKVEV